MSARPTALLLAPEAPYPVAGGGALRTASLLEYLARRYDTDAIVFRQPDAPDPAFPRNLIRRLLVLDLPYHARSLPAKAARNLSRMLRGVPPLLDRFRGFGDRIAGWLDGRRYQLGLIEHFWCAPYREQLAGHCERVVLDLHNVESALHARCAQSEGWPAALAHRRFHHASLALERALLPRFDLVLASSEADAGRVRAIAPTSRTGVFPNTIQFIPRPHPAEQDAIIFTGNLEYHPNQTAVRFFRSRIWPLLRARWPTLIWRLAGKNPDAVRKYVREDQRIELIGPVEDAIAYLARAKVAVVPLLAGSGTRFKIVEAWAAGRAVVSTSSGAEGLPVHNGEHLLIADSAEDFAQAVSALLESSERRSALGSAGRQLYERCLTWEAGWSSLEKLGI